MCDYGEMRVDSAGIWEEEREREKENVSECTS